MKRKARNILWITSLFLISFPIGYIFVFVNGSSYERSEYVLNFIVGGISFIIVLGIISVIIYAILKDRKSSDPAKPALTTYSIIAALFLISSSFKYIGAVKKMNRDEFLYKNKDKLYEGFVLKIKEMKDVPPDLKNRDQEICDCIKFKLEYDNELLDALMSDKAPFTFVERSPKMNEAIHGCFVLLEH